MAARLCRTGCYENGEPRHSANTFVGQESQEQSDAELPRLSAAPISRGAQCMPLERVPGEWSVLLIYEIHSFYATDALKSTDGLSRGHCSPLSTSTRFDSSTATSTPPQRLAAQLLLEHQRSRTSTQHQDRIEGALLDHHAAQCDRPIGTQHDVIGLAARATLFSKHISFWRARSRRTRSR